MAVSGWKDLIEADRFGTLTQAFQAEKHRLSVNVR
jgi:hypothetical protein